MLVVCLFVSLYGFKCNIYVNKKRYAKCKVLPLFLQWLRDILSFQTLEKLRYKVCKVCKNLTVAQSLFIVLKRTVEALCFLMEHSFCFCLYDFIFTFCVFSAYFFVFDFIPVQEPCGWEGATLSIYANL